MTNHLVGIMKQRGWSRWELAIRARVSPVTIRAIERFNHRPRPDVCERIAETLGVRVEEIWSEPAEGKKSEALIDRRADH